MRATSPAIGSNRTFTRYLIAIAGLALSVRLYRLFGRHLCYWDEGIFLMGARFVHWRAHYLAAKWGILPGSSLLTLSPEHYAGYPVFLQKPFHVLLLSITTLLTGMRDWAASLHSAVFGTGAVILTAVLGRRFFTPATGLLAGFFLALEPYHVHYSRLGLHETDSMFLMLLGTWLCFWGIQGRRLPAIFSAGAVLALAMGASYRLFPYLFFMGLIVCIEAFLRERRLPAMLRDAAFYAAGALAAFLFLDIAYRLAFYPEYLWSQPASYFALLKKKFLSGETAFDLDYPFFYAKMFARFDGILPAVWMLAAAMGLPLYRRRSAGYVFVFFVFPLVMFSVTFTRLARTVTGLLPWGMIALAAGVMSLLRIPARPAWRNGLAAGVAAAALLSFAMHLPPLYRIQSGYGEVFQYLDARNAPYCLSTMKPVFAFYRGRGYVRDIPKTLPELCRIVQETGVRYACMDWQKYVRYWPSFQFIETHAEPVFMVCNPVVDFFATLHENYLPMDLPRLVEIDPSIRYIKIYDLYPLLEKIHCAPPGRDGTLQPSR